MSLFEYILSIWSLEYHSSSQRDTLFIIHNIYIRPAIISSLILLFAKVSFNENQCIHSYVTFLNHKMTVWIRVAMLGVNMIIISLVSVSFIICIVKWVGPLLLLIEITINHTGLQRNKRRKNLAKLIFSWSKQWMMTGRVAIFISKPHIIYLGVKYKGCILLAWC